MHIIGLAGKKQSGKNTLGNYLVGHVLKLNDIIDKFFINPNGELVVNCTYADESGNIKHDMGVLDLNQQSDLFLDFAAGRIWPFIKTYSFADPLKQFCINVLGLTYEQVYGTDEQKNSLTHLKWENMPGVTTEVTPQDPVNEEVAGRLGKYYEKVLSGVVYHPSGCMTAREVMQFFGTEVCRKMYDNVWVNAILRQIQIEQPPIAVITDCRFPNEVSAVREVGKVVHLTRTTQSDGHKSEIALDGYAGYDHEINNSNLTIEQSCEEFLIWCVNQGITSYIKKPTVRTIKNG